jgi:hypothetical protein
MIVLDTNVISDAMMWRRRSGLNLRRAAFLLRVAAGGPIMSRMEAPWLT